MQSNQTSLRPHCHILGAGAIGGLFAARLVNLGFPVTLIDKFCSNDERSLRLVGAEGELELTIASESPDASKPIELLWVATKSHAVLNAVASVQNRLTPGSVIVTLGNGMGYHALLARQFPRRVIAGSTTAGVTAATPELRLVAGQGETRLGWWHGEGEPPGWFGLLGAAKWRCSWESNIQMRLLEKLALNGVINPATALLDIANGALLEPGHRDTLETATAELTARLNWAGYPEIAAALPDQLNRVLADTATNSSSMRIDRQQGRITEHEAILGYLLDQMGEANSTQPPPAPLLASWLMALRRPVPVQ